MTDTVAVSREAMRAAFQVRRLLSIPRDTPLNPFDVSQSLGVDVWFMDTPSLEGMFSRSPDPRIILPSWNHRPIGRLSFSCAHELGHSQLNHGNRIDEYIESPRSRKEPEEVAADVFASSLLMPRPAVLRRFVDRGISPDAAGDVTLLTIAFDLSVGLETLIKHMRWGLGLINDATMRRYLKPSPKSIRRAAFGASAPSVIVPLDHHFAAPSVDLEVGQAVARPAGARDASNCGVLSSPVQVQGWDVFTAERAGVTEIALDHRMLSVRVAREAYVGAWQNRFLDDPEAL